MIWSDAERSALGALFMDGVKALAVRVARYELEEEAAREEVIRLSRASVCLTPDLPPAADTPDERLRLFHAATIQEQNHLLWWFDESLYRAKWPVDHAVARVRRACKPMLDSQCPRAQIEATARRLAGDALPPHVLAWALEQEVGWWVRRRRAAARRP